MPLSPALQTNVVRAASRWSDHTSNLRVSLTTRAAAFSTLWSLSRSVTVAFVVPQVQHYMNHVDKRYASR